MFPDCIVREVLDLGREPRDRRPLPAPRAPAEGEVRGRAVVVACACVQSIALLLMSTSAPLSERAGQLERPARPALHPALHRRDRVRARGPARQAADQRRGLSRSRLPAVVHAHAGSASYARSFGAQLNYQNRRLAGWAKTIGGFGRAYKASVKAAYPALHAVHAVRRDAAERAVVRRSRSAIGPTSSGCRWRGATCSGARTKRRCSTTWCAGAWRCSRRPARRY